MKLKGRTALVTGGSRGIGRAIALALAEEGADVAVNFVSSEPAAKEVAEQIRKMGRQSILAQADVGDYPDTFRMAQDLLKEFGHLDILVNNAGINSDKTFVKMDHASWRKVLAMNLDGVFNCTKVFVDQMISRATAGSSTSLPSSGRSVTSARRTTPPRRPASPRSPNRSPRSSPARASPSMRWRRASSRPRWSRGFPRRFATGSWLRFR